MLVNKSPRFDFDANTIEEAIEYMNSRATQLLRFSYKLLRIVTKEWGISAFFDHNGTIYQSLYILKDYRGKGIFKQNVIFVIITSSDCGISNYLTKNNLAFIEVDFGFPEYDFISNIYGGNKTKRSGVSFMNHIDEGLYILEMLGASDFTKRAYTLHPLLQGDSELAENYLQTQKFNASVILLTMEYRSVANAYLSSKTIIDIDDIILSPLKEVNQMLIADKIQNRKDFLLYHKGTHPRSDELELYFNNWMKKLDITDEFYERCEQYCTSL